MKERDDSKVFLYSYKGFTFRYTVSDTNIKTYDNGEHFYFNINVIETDNKTDEFIVNFRLASDDIDTAHSIIEDEIIKKVEKMK